MEICSTRADAPRAPNGTPSTERFRVHKHDHVVFVAPVSTRRFVRGAAGETCAWRSYVDVLRV